eukprot:4028901-Pyramimonas_sp.AAC.1
MFYRSAILCRMRSFRGKGRGSRTTCGITLSTARCSFRPQPLGRVARLDTSTPDTTLVREHNSSPACMLHGSRASAHVKITIDATACGEMP